MALLGRIISGFFGLIFFLLISYFGFTLMNQHEPLLFWIGFVLVLLGSANAFHHVISITSASISQSNRYLHEYNAVTPSNAYGDSKLADNSDLFIKAMREPIGAFIGALNNRLLFHNPFESNEAHMITFGMTRSGKSISLTIPSVLNWVSMNGSMLVTDTKGEIYKITSRFLRRAGFKVIEWNPFGIHGEMGVSINPFQILINDVVKNNGENIDEIASDLATILLPPEPNEHQPFFRDEARTLITALLLYLAIFEKGKCHPPGLREMVWSSTVTKKRIQTMLKSCSAYGGLLQEYAEIFDLILDPQYVRTAGPQLQLARKATRLFRRGGKFGKSLMQSDYDLENFLEENTVLFIVYSERTSKTFGVATRLFTSILMNMVSDRPKGRPIMMMLEEAGNIGMLPNLDSMLSLMTAKNVRLWMIFQAQSQLTYIYGKEIAKIAMGNCSFKQLLSCDDPEELQQWSDRTGKKTVKNTNYSFDPKSDDIEFRLNINERGENVLTADAIARLEQGMQIIDRNGKRVTKAALVAYFEVREMRNVADFNPYHPSGYPKDKTVRFNLRGNT